MLIPPRAAPRSGSEAEIMKLKCGCEIDHWPISLCGTGAMIAGLVIFMIGFILGRI